MAGKVMIKTTFGMRGRFPIMYDNDGPIQTGMTAKDFKQCKRMAIDWAKAEFGEGWQDHTSLREVE